MIQVKFHAVDCFNRPVFKNIKSKQFYGDVNNLFDRDATAQEVLNSVKASDLLYFGAKFGCEPCGYPCKVEIIG